MSDQHRPIQVVFLIDTNRDVAEFKNAPNQDQNSFVNSVCLCAFRLLSYFDHQSGASKTKRKNKPKSHLKWGFKFFNSQYHQSRIKRYSLTDFKIRHFEEFENEIERKFEVQDQVNGQKQTGSDCLRKALIELIHDFQWQVPDITSPVKRFKRSRQPITENANAYQNFVFLFSVCPNNAVRLRRYAGKRVMDAGVFVDSFMPESLQKEFCDMYRLKLIWVNCLQGGVAEDADPTSVKLTCEAIEQLGGKLILMENLVQLCHLQSANLGSVDISFGSDVHSSTDLETGGENSSSDVCNKPQNEKLKENPNYKLSRLVKTPRPVLPFSSIIESIFSEKNDLKPCAEFVDSNRETTLKSSTCAIIKLQDDKKISVEVQKSLKSHSLKDRNVGGCVELSLATSSQSILVDDTAVDGNIQPTLCNEDGNLCFQLFGLLMDDGCLNSRYTTDKTFVCTSSDSEFSRLLTQLTAEKRLLVLQGGGNCCLFILKPLTAVSATLSSLSLGKTLQLEKALLQDRVLSEKSESPKSKRAKIAASGAKWESLPLKLCNKKLTLKTAGNVANDGAEQMKKGAYYDPKTVDKAYLPGAQLSLLSLVDKLNDRISQLDFLSEDELKTLRDLQQLYRYEVHPPRPWDDPRISTGKSNDEQNTSVSKQESKKGKGSVASRGEIMVTRSRQSVIEVKSESDEKVAADTKPVTKRSIPVINTDFEDENELEAYLRNSYETTLSSDGSLLLCAQTVIMVSLHYMKEKKKDDPEECCDKFLRSSIILPVSGLREKYQSTNDTMKQQKIREYQLQILLRLECQSVQTDSDNSNDEVVTLLRAISFVSEPSSLSSFMGETLVDHYIHTIPHTLGSIYDELMQPLPAALESLLSPDHSLDQSVLSQSMASVDNSRQASPEISASQPASMKGDVLLNRTKHNTRKRSLVHHPSLADVGPKRQIVVNVDSKPASKKRKSTHKKDAHHPSKKKVKEKGSAEKVCRNLFESDKRKLERRQSVAVMENLDKKEKSRKRRFHVLKSPRGLKSPPFMKKVSETPLHKQKTQNILSRIEKRRYRSMSVATVDTEVNVVEESPVKSSMSKYSPVQNKRALAMLRRSFYSAGPTNRSRNLTKSFQLADRIAGRKSTSSRLSLGSFLNDSASELKSPDKSNSSFVFSQLMGSPTPPKSTPRKPSITPAKLVMESPSMNTRSQSPRCFDGTPRKGVTVLDSPSMNTRSMSPGYPATFQKALFRESPCSSKKDRNVVLGSGKKITGDTPVKGDALGVCGSPSQNTRSKLVSTPSFEHKPTRAKMFLFRSPEAKVNKNSQTSSISVSKCRQLSNFEERLKSPGDVPVNSVSNTEDVGSASVVCNRTPSPCKLRQTNSEETPPSRKKLMLSKTPTSLDQWPRKKKGCTGSPTLSPSVANKLKTKQTFACKGETSICGSMSTVEADVIKPQCNPLSISSASQELQQRNGTNIGNSGNEDIFTGLSQGSSVGRTSSFNLKKRSLHLSPESASLSSPNKRQRRSHLDSLVEHPQEKLPVSYCLHRRVLSQKIPSVTASQGSQGFDTEALSQGSVGALSQTSVESLEYFSLSNDEVFICPKKDSKYDDDARSESPVFGASPHLRSGLSICKNAQSADQDSVSFSPVVSEGSGPSPSDRKYSPSVSARSLMHLMNSPLMRNSKENLTSPKINQDSLNVRRQKTRSKRSLNMQM